MVDGAKQKLQAELIEQLTQLQKDYHKALTKRQQLDSQYNENSVVQEELSHLRSGNKVYKLVGPVLVEQSYTEAKENVAKRMEYIAAEIKRTDEAIKALQEKQEMHKKRLERLQQSG